MLDVVARTISIMLDLMQCFVSDSHDTVVVLFRCVQLSPGVFSSLETVTVSDINCHNFITKRFYQKPVVIFDPCII